MWIFPLVGYLGSIVGFCFLTLAIASALYYLSELVEEHTVIAKRFLSRLIFFVVALRLALCLVDRFPFLPTALGVASHLVYLLNMRRFPFVRLSDPLFVASCVLVLLDHYVWFRHFSDYQHLAYQATPYYQAADVPTFTEIASYFGLCVWLVPFALFVSLSASDNVLPTSTGESDGLISPGLATAAGMMAGSGMSAGSTDAEGGGARSRRGQGMAKALVDNVRGAITDVGVMVGWKKQEHRS